MSTIEENEFVKAALQLAEADRGRELTPLEREQIIASHTRTSIAGLGVAGVMVCGSPKKED